MRKMACFTLGIVLALIATITAQSLPITKERLRFELSAKGLPDKDDLGTIDPYVEVFYTEGGNNQEIKLGTTDAISDNENPTWAGKVFEFNFDRNKNQKWHFKIWDKDHAREDDKGGQVWVDVNDYVDKGQLIHANLDKQGYLTVKSSDSRVQQNSQYTPGTLPYSPGSPDTGLLTFKISASGLKDKDKLGKTDPYVEISYTNGLTGKKTYIGRSTTISNTKNPQWGESFTLNWDRKKDQRLYFKISDNDNFREDDTVGKAWLEVNDYVAKGQRMTVHLNKQGTLTLERADGLPVNPYDPTLAANRPPLPYYPNSPPQGISTTNPAYPQPGTPVTNPKYQQPVAPAPVAPAPVAPVQIPAKLRFKLSGSNFPDKDLIGTSDPYAKVFISQEGQPETLLKKGTKLSDNENPQWDDIYEFNYDPAKRQKLRFLILDEDDGRRDDEIGNVSVDASDLVSRNYITLNLPVGYLTISKY